jgi:hydroxyacylglutathione hydrolase
VKETGSYEQFIMSLKKLKSFPNECMIFPGHDNAFENLMFVKTLDPKNPMLGLRLRQFEEIRKQGMACAPSMMIEEKNYNPFLRCDDRYYQDLTGEKDPLRVFQKLKKVQESFYKL